MISKNTDKFIVTVTNRQLLDGDVDCIKESGLGSLRVSGGKYYVMYKTENATVMIKVDGECVNVKRTGDARSDMDYKCGETTYFMYNTPYGAMEMELFTKKLEYSLNSGGGTINLKYSLCGIENDMCILVDKDVE